MADKSWGGDTSAGFRVRTNATSGERAAERARARDARALDRATEVAARLETRAATRQADIVAREAVRTARRESEAQAAQGDPHAAAAQRRRSSGRKDVVREQRDTRGYTTIVDSGRIRELAKRGASPSALAGAFGIPIEEVEKILAQDDVGSVGDTA